MQVDPNTVTFTSGRTGAVPYPSTLAWTIPATAYPTAGEGAEVEGTLPGPEWTPERSGADEPFPATVRCTEAGPPDPPTGTTPQTSTATTTRPIRARVQAETGARADIGG